MNFADLIGYVAAGLGSIIFVPQVVKAWRTKQTKDISFVSFALLAFVALLWVIYGVLLKAGPIIFVNSVVCSLSIVLLFLKSKYG